MSEKQATEIAPELGYTRDRSFYASRPTGGSIKVHRESTAAPGMAACNTRKIMLYTDSAWDIEETRREHPYMLCRRCYPPEQHGKD